ncbi:Amino acid adenylation domain-containing protein (Fragment) OS=Streptomyces tendae OX=1932 GN=GUR47_38495 PE=4 SV=1 [Streptomyces tendae]
MSEAVVIARPDTPGSLRLAAYIVPHEADAGDVPSDLPSHARTWLPDFMVPSALVAVEEFPLLPNGKIDRSALPDPDPGANRTPSRPPSGPAEELIARVWSELLGITEIGADEDFFALGGHSLLATRVVSRLTTLTGAEIPLHLVFENSVPPTWPACCPIQRAGRPAPPASSASGASGAERPRGDIAPRPPPLLPPPSPYKNRRQR